MNSSAITMIAAAWAVVLAGGCDSGIDPGRLGRPSNVQIVPPDPRIEIQSTIQLDATLLDAAGNRIEGRKVFWSSENPSIAEVSSTTGLVTAKGLGSTRIAASAEGVDALTTVTVVPLGVASVAVSPASVVVDVGKSVSLQAEARNKDGGVVQGRPVVWSSGSEGIATVDGSGKVTGVAVGATKITASVDGRTATADVEVRLPPVASVSIAPTSAVIAVGTTRTFTATARDAEGNALQDRQVQWSTSNQNVVTVSGSGLAEARGPGSANVIATVEGKNAEATVTVPPVIGTSTLTLVSGDDQRAPNNEVLPQPLVVRLLDDRGRPVAGVLVHWTTNNGFVAPTAVATDVNGFASTTWTLGGGSPTLVRLAWAEVEGLPPVEFRAQRQQ